MSHVGTSLTCMYKDGAVAVHSTDSSIADGRSEVHACVFAR